MRMHKKPGPGTRANTNIMSQGSETIKRALVKAVTLELAIELNGIIPMYESNN